MRAAEAGDRERGEAGGARGAGSVLPSPRDLLPEVWCSEYHERVLDAPAEAVGRAVLDVTVREIHPLGLLMAVRGLPALVAGRAWRRGQGGGQRLMDAFAEGFTVLARRPDGYVFASIGQPHRWTGGASHRFGTADEFTGFAEPGYCKIIADFRVTERAGRRVVSTETLVGGTDPATRRAFRRYWLVIRPFSGLIRRGMLAAVARRARRDPPARH